MSVLRAASLALVAAMVLGACVDELPSSGPADAASSDPSAAGSESTASSDPAVATTMVVASPSGGDAAAGADDAPTIEPASTEPPPTDEAPADESTIGSTTAPTTTTPIITLASAYDPDCVVEAGDGDTLDAIATRFDDETVDVAALRAENGLSAAPVAAGTLIDVCVGNGLDDIVGVERTPNEEKSSAHRALVVTAQQLKLNKLFDGLGIRELLVDGISGPVTRQRLCAFRVAAGLPPSLADMEEGSDEERKMYATPELPMPFTTALLSDRWILIDRTCQVMFVGSADRELRFVFPTSTGEQGFETRDQDRTRAFRYDPARDNDGWHNSTDFPVPADNPLNGNMYRPLYFDNGQAIHGANNVPRTPASKGCARLRVEHQDMLIGWLGLADASGPTGSASRINVTVNVQGAFVHG